VKDFLNACYDHISLGPVNLGAGKSLILPYNAKSGTKALLKDVYGMLEVTFPKSFAEVEQEIHSHPKPPAEKKLALWFLIIM